jgi:hypothetical protein
MFAGERSFRRREVVYEWYVSEPPYTVATGLEETSAYFSEYVSSQGPFDGILGFSQGGFLASGWMGMHEKAREKGVGPDMSTFKFFISVAAGPARQDVFKPAFAGDPLKFPSLVFLGERDFMRDWGQEFVSYCKDSVVIEHPRAHVVPKLSESEGKMFRDFLLKQLESKSAS